MTTTFIISYIVLAHYCWGYQFIVNKIKKKSKTPTKEQHFATRQSNQSKFKASDLKDRTTDQSSQHTAKEHVLTIEAVSESS